MIDKTKWLPTEKQKKVIEDGGVTEEKKAKEWLEEHGFKITWYLPHRHAGHFDIQAEKGGNKWIIEVKSGKEPQVNIENILKMINTEGFNRIGLIFIPESNNVPILFELKKMGYAGLKASKTKGKQVEKEAGEKGWKTMRAQGP